MSSAENQGEGKHSTSPNPVPDNDEQTGPQRVVELPRRIPDPSGDPTSFEPEEVTFESRRIDTRRRDVEARTWPAPPPSPARHNGSSWPESDGSWPSGPAAEAPAGPRPSAGQQPSAPPQAHAGRDPQTPAQGQASGPNYPRAGEVAPPATPGDAMADQFRQESFTSGVKPRPQSGWRKAVLKSSFGLINPGESTIEREDRERRDQVRANIPRTAFIYAVLSPRGGVSKTTTTAALGSMFAHLRGAEVVAVDANPVEGNLASRINPEATATFEDLLRDRSIVSGVNDIRSYTRRNASHLDVLASSTAHIDPARFTPRTLVDTLSILRRGYRVIGIDCGQDVNDDTVATILDVVTAVVVVTNVQFDAGRAALRLHDRLLAHGRSQLLQRSFLVISDRSPVPDPASRAKIEHVVSGMLWKDPLYVPYDPHLKEATVINLEQLAKPTYRAYLEGAARLSAWYGQPALAVRRVGRR